LLDEVRRTSMTGTELGLGVLLALVLVAALLVPYLVKEIGKGKVQLGPRTPAGTGDVTPGTVRNPAPGQPDGQADPYGPRAQRDAPEVKS
jgi:hypothetical protein